MQLSVLHYDISHLFDYFLASRDFAFLDLAFSDFAIFELGFYGLGVNILDLNADFSLLRFGVSHCFDHSDVSKKKKWGSGGQRSAVNKS